MDKNGEFTKSSPCSECGSPGYTIHGQHALCERHKTSKGDAMPEAISKVAKLLRDECPERRVVMHDPEL